MAMTLQEVKDLLEEAKIKYRVDETHNFVSSVWTTDHYKDKDGDNGIRVIVRLEEDGEYVKVFTPTAYQYKEGPSLLAVLETCMHISWRTKMVQFEYDPSDGEIRAIIEFPLEDAKLTAKQLKRMVSGLAGIVDEYDPMIRAAMETGKFVPAKEEDDGMSGMLSTLADLGPEGVKELMEEIRKRKAGGKGAGTAEVSPGRPSEL